MVLCKIMSNNEDEVSNILSAKLSIKFSGVEIDAMKVCLAKKNEIILLQVYFRSLIKQLKFVI